MSVKLDNDKQKAETLGAQNLLLTPGVRCFTSQEAHAAEYAL